MFNTRPCKQMDLLTNYSAKSWLKERPEKLMSFLPAMWNLNSEEEFDAYEIASLIEQLYGCRNEKLALPISFRHILLTYNLSYNLSPAGSFTFLKDWLLENALDEIEFPKGLVRAVFDNKQVVGKRYSVKTDCNAVPVSVITSFAYLCIDTSSNIQNQ